MKQTRYIIPVLLLIAIFVTSCAKNGINDKTEVTSTECNSISNIDMNTEFFPDNTFDILDNIKTYDSTIIKQNEDIDSLRSQLQTAIDSYKIDLLAKENEIEDLNNKIDALQKLVDDAMPMHDEYITVGGHGLVFSFPLAGPYYMSDHTFVGDELWFFIVSNDGHTNYSKVLRYSIDFNKKAVVLMGEFKHNFGHCNTVDYCPETNTLIMGNGGGSDNPENDQIYIFKNADRMKYYDTVNLESSAVIIDLDNLGLDWGKQVNVCWGESNNGKFNIAYAISNDGSTKTIRKLLLGQGKNKLDYGSLVYGVGNNEFNGTFKILQTWETPYSSYICNQGADWYQGKLYEGVGHDGMWHFEHELLQNGIITKQNQEFFYNDDGSKRIVTTEGVAIKDGYMIMGNITDFMVYVYWVG